MNTTYAIILCIAVLVFVLSATSSTKSEHFFYGPRGGGRGGRGGGGGRGGRGGRGGGRGGRGGGRRPRHHRGGWWPYGNRGWYSGGWQPYWWYAPDMYPIYSYDDISTYASPSWCWSRVYATEASQNGVMTKQDWAQWASTEGMKYVLFPKQFSNELPFILVPSSNLDKCEFASSDVVTLRNYDLRLLN